MNTSLTVLALALSAAPFLVGQEAPPPPPPKAMRAPAAPRAPLPTMVAQAPQAPTPPTMAPKAPAVAPVPPAPQAPAAPLELDPVLAKQFKTRLFFVQHRSASFVGLALKPLLSGAKGSVIDWNTSQGDGLKAISVRDFPENLAVMEEALKRLDAPLAAQARKNVEFHIHVLFASPQKGKSEDVPAELTDVLATLKDTLKYRSYTHAATFIQRSVDGAVGLGGDGQLENVPLGEKPGVEPSRMKATWRAHRLEVRQDGDRQWVSLTDFSLSVQEKTPTSSGQVASLGSEVTLKSGEKVVVGTSAVKDHGLIVVVTAKVLN